MIPLHEKSSACQVCVKKYRMFGGKWAQARKFSHPWQFAAVLRVKIFHILWVNILRFEPAFVFSRVLCSIIVLSYEQIVCKHRKQETAVFIKFWSSGSSALPGLTQKSGGQLLTKLHQQESQATSPTLSCFMEFLQGQILRLKPDLQCWPFWFASFVCECDVWWCANVFCCFMQCWWYFECFD